VPPEGEGLEPLAGEATQVTDEESDGAEGEALPDEIPGESTRVTDEPDAIHTDPGIELPYEGDLAFEATQAAVEAPEPEPGLESLPPVGQGERTTSPDPAVEELPAESTLIVQPGQTQQPAEVYTFDVESGQISQSVDLPDAIPGRSPIGLIVGVAIVALFVVIAGIGIGYVVFSDDGVETVAQTGADGTEDGAEDEIEAAEPAEAAEPVAVAEPAEGDAPAEPEEPEEQGEEPAPEETPEPAPAPAVGAASIGAIEAYELELPRVSARARRMSEADRLRRAGRHRARAMRAYRDEEWADAVENFSAALTYNNWDVAAVEGMARTKAQLGEYPEAVAWAELAVQRNPRSATTFRVLGDVWRQAGHDDRARAAYRRGLRRHREDRWLRQRLRDLEEGDQ